ncbi:MAG: Gfo/Idh/MocA family oxidoreductase [Bacteroidaceae bacterium]
MRQPVLSLSCAPIPLVHIGFIGLGKRGQKAIARYLSIERAHISALADLKSETIQSILPLIPNHQPKTYVGENAWKQLCENKDLDLIYICTDWASHAEMAIYAMQNGKHVAIEVPAATTVAECWELINTAEETRKHCTLLENCCYDRFALATLRMAQSGLLGELTHCEGAYIHNLQTYFSEDNRTLWMQHHCKEHTGNPYPTHGIGPIAQLLHIHRGDRMTSLTSLTAKNGTETGTTIIGSVNNTLIRTSLGKSILLQYDLSTPRPYSRMQTTCGTNGFTQKYPIPIAMLRDETEPYTDKRLDHLLKQYEHPITTFWKEQMKRAKQENDEMNYIMDCRLIYCLRKGLPLDIDVYDAAEWSCIAELSELSSQKGGEQIEIPDFTRGHWNDTKSLNLAE